MNIIGIMIVVIFAVIIVFALIGYPMITDHKVTMIIDSKFIDNSGKESHYLIKSKDNKIVELNRPVYDLTDNIDMLYFNAVTNKTVTYECFGWELYGLHQYSTCFKEIEK